MKHRILFLLFPVFIAATFTAGARQIAKDGFTASMHDITTKVVFITDDIVRVYKYPKGGVDERKSRVVNRPLSHGPITMGDGPVAITAASRSLKVRYDKVSGTLTFYRANTLLAAEAPGTVSFVPVDDDGKPAWQVTQGFAFQKDEAVYGFGQHQNGKLNQRFEELLLRQRNMSIAIPFFQSVKGYGIYWDNYSLSRYIPGAEGGTLTSEVGDGVAYYFIAAKNADGVISNYRLLTGSVPMLPLWSLGYVQSRERYRSQYELVDVVKKYRELEVPLDAVIQDWQYWGSNDSNWNAVGFNNPGFPDPGRAIDSIHRMHAKVLISVWPSFGAGTGIYKELEKKGMLYHFYTFPVKNYVKVYDAFNPAARNIYWDYMNKNLFSLGIDGWWLDATEPVQKSVTGNTDRKANEHEIAVKDLLTSVEGVSTHIGSFKRYGNLYPYEAVKGVYEGQRNTNTGKRAYILTRSAFAGQQQTGSMLWSGDVTASWEVLKAQIPAALNLTMSGMPYWNSDIGGFFVRNYPGGIRNLHYRELYIRWLQFAAFTALMRSHGTNTPREIYQLGKRGDIAFDVAEKFIRLRYRLQPYIYSAMWAVTRNNASLMRPLVMDYPEDPMVWNNNNTYLFGESILVNPVTDSIFKTGVTALNDKETIAVDTRLPAGWWYDFWSDAKHRGGTAIAQKISLSGMPVFIRAGTILPLAAVPQYSAISNFKDLEIKIYPGKSGTFELYEDEGNDYSYEKGQCSLIRFSWNDKTRVLTVEPRRGAFNGMSGTRGFTIRIAGTKAVKQVTYSGARVLVRM
ncbi:glycoside hydrolase family 31 protein [Niabella drilacis]|uniref:Alpha-D-xyloside xylohydrolase n=1 Tax=Niabella drilacis (strain DSM 25811 / CCM 8410 / CCUG 62505 / LMG 26954 / E90) TaxID=1285928 RepID=A0A1G6TAJ0_NIADE|nr:TIM-barrel domain-containing protein [Niabella drilacis]SDD25854.1 alpha-D-xyloside xylohydrolase [Niabella drilacis]